MGSVIDDSFRGLGSSNGPTQPADAFCGQHGLLLLQGFWGASNEGAALKRGTRLPIPGRIALEVS